MRTFRIGDPEGRFPIYSGEGAALLQGRWHERGQDVIYASEHYSTAMLEKLANYNGVMPPNQHFIEIDIPAGTSYELVTKDSLPGWAMPNNASARVHGADWFSERRSAILIVPSFVAREDRNVLINPHHSEFGRIRVGLEMPIRWDRRLFEA